MNTNSYRFVMNPITHLGEIQVLFAGYEQTRPLHHIGPKVLDYYLIHFIENGKGTFRCMEKTYPLEKGDQFVIFPHDLIAYESDAYDPWSYRWIGFKGTAIDQLLSQAGVSSHSPIVRAPHSRKITTLFHRIEVTLREAKANCDLQAGAYMRLLLAHYFDQNNIPTAPQRADNQQQQHVERAIQWMKWQYSKPITIEQMADDLGYHRTYMSKLFKTTTGISPIEYLIKLRLEKAKNLLPSQLTIEQIATSVGYQDPLYFSKQFKKVYGVSPSEYRLANKKSIYDCKN